MIEKKNKPLISILMADYNTDPENLASAVESILDQTYDNFEFIIVDDGSTRNTQTVLQKLQDIRMTVIRHEVNRGFVAALNTGLRAAKGEFIVRMDTDDLVDPTYVDTLVTAMEQNPEYSVISCRARQFRDDGSLGPIVGQVGEKRAKNIIRRDPPVHGASIMRRSDLVEVGGYPDYRRAEDFALWCELLLHGKRLKVIEPVLYKHRVNAADYSKRRLRHRTRGISALFFYYPKLGASVLDYRYIAMSVIAGALPSSWLKRVSETLRAKH